MLFCVWIPLDLCQSTVRNDLSMSKFMQNTIGIRPLYEAVTKEVKYVFSCSEREKLSYKQQTQQPLKFLTDVVYTDTSPSQVHFTTTLNTLRVHTSQRVGTTTCTHQSPPGTIHRLPLWAPGDVGKAGEAAVLAGALEVSP